MIFRFEIPSICLEINRFSVDLRPYANSKRNNKISNEFVSIFQFFDDDKARITWDPLMVASIPERYGSQ